MKKENPMTKVVEKISDNISSVNDKLRKDAKKELPFMMKKK